MDKEKTFYLIFIVFYISCLASDLVGIEVPIFLGIVMVIITFKHPELSRNNFSGIYIKREIDLNHHKPREQMSIEYLNHEIQNIFFIRDIQCTENKVTARSLMNFYGKKFHGMVNEPDCCAEIVGNKLVVSGPRTFCKALTIRLIGRLRASIVMEE